MLIKTTTRCFLAACLVAVAALPTTATAQDIIRSFDPDQAFSADVREVSILQGGVQRLYLNATDAQAGRWYLILGSVTGTEPGIDLGGFHIPLNYDVYTQFTLMNMNRGLIVNQLGRLGADGRAEAAFFLPPKVLTPSLVGLTIHHAYVTASESGGIGMVSNPVPVTLFD